MGEFLDVIRQTKRICKSVNGNCGRCLMGEFSCPNNARLDSTDEKKFIDFANAVMSWAAEHPEPVYPTWREYLMDLILPNSPSGDFATFLLEQYIPADIAHKLGIEPKEV